MPRNGTEGSLTRFAQSPACIAFDHANDEESHTTHDASENPKLSREKEQAKKERLESEQGRESTQNPKLEQTTSLT